MECYCKYYLVKASEFNNRRARPPPTSYWEQRRHSIEHSYKELLGELTDQSARVFDPAAEFGKKAWSALTKGGGAGGRRRMLPRLPDNPTSPPHPRQASAEESEEEAGNNRDPGQTLG